MSTNWCLGTTPLWRHNNSPFRYNIKVGTPCTPRVWARPWFLSTSIFIICTCSPSACLVSCNMGAIALQGPHHVAWKSMRVGVLDCMSWSNCIVQIITIYCERLNGCCWGGHKRHRRNQSQTSPLMQNTCQSLQPAILSFEPIETPRRCPLKDTLFEWSSIHNVHENKGIAT